MSENDPRSLMACLRDIANDLDRGPGLREAAAAFASWDLPVTARDMPDLDEPALKALAAGLALRSRELLDHYGPLLELCQQGKSTAPIRDLRSTARLARAAAEALPGQGDPAHAALDAVASSLERWLPPEGSSDRLKAVVFERAAPVTSERIKAPPPEPSAPQRSPQSRRLIRVLVGLLLVGGLMQGVNLWSNRPPPPPELSSYQAVLPAVVGKTLRGDTVVVEVQDSWAKRSADDRLEDLFKLEDAMAGEGANALVLQTAGGRELASITVDKGPILATQ